MKKFLRLICLVLVVCTLCASLFACGGGDSNMHKVMDAVCSDGKLGNDGKTDVYEYKSKDVDSYMNGDLINDNFTSLKAWASGTAHPKHRVDFVYSYVDIKKDDSYKLMSMNFKWTAKENTVSVSGEYRFVEWNAARNDWNGDYTFDNYYEDKFVFDMNAYYEKGKFEASDATYTLHEITQKKLEKHPEFENMMLADIADVLTKAFDGLDSVYAPKGFPIKQTAAE